MKIPSKCPFCNNIFVKTYYAAGVRKDFSTHQCTKTSHDIKYYSSDTDSDMADEIHLIIPEISYVLVWHFVNNDFGLSSHNDNFYPLQWIDPDFSDRKKLIKKIKTMITFS